MKKLLPIALIAFIGYFLFTDPQGLAAFTKDGTTALLDGAGNLFAAIIRFLDTLFA